MTSKSVGQIGFKKHTSHVLCLALNCRVYKMKMTIRIWLLCVVGGNGGLSAGQIGHLGFSLIGFKRLVESLNRCTHESCFYCFFRCLSITNPFTFF